MRVVAAVCAVGAFILLCKWPVWGAVLCWAARLTLVVCSRSIKLSTCASWIPALVLYFVLCFQGVSLHACKMRVASCSHTLPPYL